MVALAMMVAVAIKVVGVLLVGGAPDHPAGGGAAARPHPEAMAAVAALIGGVSAMAGLWAAYWLDTPAGPSIVCVAAVIFAVTSAAGARGRG